MKKLLIAAVLALGVVALPAPAQALTYNWFYISPATCHSQNGAPAVTGGGLGLSNNGSAVCQIRVTQGATMTAARIYMNGTQSSFAIQTVPYYNPTAATTSVQWSGSASGGYLSSPAFSQPVDNNNNSYIMNISTGQATFIGNYYTLIEITYTTP